MSLYEYNAKVVEVVEVVDGDTVDIWTETSPLPSLHDL